MQSQTREFMSAWLDKYRSSQTAFKAHGLLNVRRYSSFHASVERHSQSQPQVQSIIVRAGIVDPVKNASAASKGLAYRGQAFMSTWLGSTRIRMPRQGK